MNPSRNALAPHDTVTIPLEEDKPPGIVALRDLTTGKVYPLPSGQRKFTLGASPYADIQLDDPYVSLNHCCLERDRQGPLFVADSASKNGVFVEGLRVSRAALRCGSELRVGRRELVALSARAAATKRAEDELVGTAPTFLSALAIARRAARSGRDCSVLILGETGTGKELVARMIHENSRRLDGPFVTVNCGGLTSTLIGSELFGHLRGAFTGATADHDGVFVHADQGSLFLDELGELPLEQQPQLLRALESGEVRPLGSTEVRNVSVRFIAATNRFDLGENSRLRADLYHRLATIIVRLPPLRARPTDIPLLVREFLNREGARDRRLGPTTLQALQTYPWHGNVRELRHAVKRALTLGAEELTIGAFLPELVGSPSHPVETVALRDPRSLYEDGVKQVLQAALVEHGSVRAAARALGLPKSTFADRARRLGVITF